MNAEINQVRTELLNVMAEAGRAALHFDTLGAAALAAIPNTEPQQYVIAGTAPMIAKLLPAVDVGSAVSTAVGEPVATSDQLTISSSDLMTLARRLITEDLDDCDEEFVAGRAHGVGSLHAEILGLARLAAPTQVSAPQAAPIGYVSRDTLAKLQGDDLAADEHVRLWHAANPPSRAVVPVFLAAGAPQASAAQAKRNPPSVQSNLLHWALRELLGALPERRDWFNPDAEKVLRAVADAGPVGAAQEVRAVLKGWKLMPIVPIPEMLKHTLGGRRSYDAILAAAPAAPTSTSTAPAAMDEVRNQALEEAALAAEKVQDEYSEAQGGKWPELRDDAATGAGDCAAAIRALKTSQPSLDEVTRAGKREAK